MDKDKVISYLMVIVLALFGFGVVKVCESIGKNSELVGKLFMLKVDKEDYKHELQLVWKEIDKLRR